MKSRAPKSYDEITRETVLDPDGSVRAPPPRAGPTEVAAAELRASVADALLAHGMTTIGFEVGDGQVILRGWVRDREHAREVFRLVTVAAPEVEIIDHLHVGPS